MTRGFFGADDLDLAAFTALIEQVLDPSDVPRAASRAGHVPIYDAAHLPLEGPDRADILSEWAWIFGPGPGVLVIKGAVDTDAVDAASAVFAQIIAQEAQASDGKGDHFGTNTRIWNSHQKLCLAAPEIYARYTASPAIAMAAEAWLGPHYQVTAQVNLVRPGGAAQEAHRDYHLGFQSEAEARRWPVHAHALSAGLTLQGAVAHCAMPVESGPTMLLPYSQAYGPGYLAYRRPAFRALFAERAVQLPLEAGDALFFNPAMFHAAGANRTQDIERLANLLQISSAFGRATEALDRDAMCRAVFPHLERFDGVAREAIIAATAEGYPFPTNLDSDPPIGGLAPKSQADFLREAESADALAEALDALSTRRRA